MKPAEWVRVYKRIDHRSWHDISQSWPDFSPPGLVNITDVPDGDAVDDHELSNWISTYPTGSAEERTSMLFPYYRARLLYESCFSMTKSIYILEGVVDSIIAGCPSWTQSDAYQSAFFCMHAILGLLGLHIVEISGRSFVIDLWPEPDKRRSRRPSQQLSTLAIACRAPLHTHRWGAFQRILRVSTVSLWPTDITSMLVSLSDRDFASQRNRLHYHSDYWPLPDIAGRLDMHTSTTAMIMPDDATSVDPQEPYFSLWLAISMLKLGMLLGQDLTKSIGALKPSFGHLNDRLSLVELTLK